ncbi:MAG: CDP-glycerol glycerophosphotransferase family protein, partial [Clostridia bacterium]|nr:CDP-glycerol glycerophosphotransferase family protein [Clostridia bacterium]
MAKPYTFKMKCKHFVIRSMMTAFRVFPINRKKIVICNYFGKGYGDNGKAIAEALLKRDPELDIVWGVKSQFKGSLPENIRAVEYNSVKYLWELATAAAWVDNSRKNAGIKKRKKQFYVQTWHGTVALKRIEKDVEENLDEFYVAGAKNDSKMANIILSGCRFFTELCRRTFWFDGEIAEVGSPRSDALFNTDESKQAEVKKALGIPQDKKVVLYAPTFRADGNLECYNMDFEAVLDALEKKTGDSWVFCM